MCAAEMEVDANLVPGQRNPAAAECLKLDVYRQLFDVFIDGFSAYKPLLTQIKVFQLDMLPLLNAPYSNVHTAYALQMPMLLLS